MPLLCPFLFSSHVAIGGEVAREEKNYCSSLFFFSARYVFLVIQYFYTFTVPWGKFFRQYCAPAFLPLYFFAKL